MQLCPDIFSGVLLQASSLQKFLLYLQSNKEQIVTRKQGVLQAAENTEGK